VETFISGASSSGAASIGSSAGVPEAEVVFLFLFLLFFLCCLFYLLIFLIAALRALAVFLKLLSTSLAGAAVDSGLTFGATVAFGGAVGVALRVT